VELTSWSESAVETIWPQMSKMWWII
jgi:hypothetical protein